MKKYREYIERLRTAYIESPDRETAIVQMHHILFEAGDDMEISFGKYKKIYEAMKALEYSEVGEND